MGSVNKTANYGLNQWQGNEYPKRQDFADDNAKIDAQMKANADTINAHKADQTVHVTTLACAKSGTVYALTGLTASSGKVRVMFSVPSAYAAGDTVTIDGTAYTLKTTDGSALTAGAWAAGAMIAATADVDSKVLYVGPAVPHTKADIGLGNVDNTADADKAVKYATYSSHAVSSSGSAVRNNTISSSMPTGGQDGDTWDVYDT